MNTKKTGRGFLGFVVILIFLFILLFMICGCTTKTSTKFETIPRIEDEFQFYTSDTEFRAGNVIKTNKHGKCIYIFAVGNKDNVNLFYCELFKPENSKPYFYAYDDKNNLIAKINEGKSQEQIEIHIALETEQMLKLIGTAYCTGLYINVFDTDNNPVAAIAKHSPEAEYVVGFENNKIPRKAVLSILALDYENQKQREGK